MNVFCFALALLLPLIIGFLLVLLCWPEKTVSPPLMWCQLCLSAGIGLGISSFTSFLTLLLAGTANIFVTFLLEAGLISLFIILLRRRQQPLFPILIRHDEETNVLTRILAIAFYLSLILAIGFFMLRSIENPHGEPDAWTFWNLRARLFFRSGVQWREIFSQGNWPFPKYPQLLPMNIVRLWSAFGRETFAGAIAIAFMFTFATIGLLTSALILFRGRSQGYLAGLLLTSTPYFLKHGASQYADIPFGCYVLMTLLLFLIRDKHPQHPSGLLVLTGISAGLSTWTKEEGWLLLAAILTAREIVLVLFRARMRDIFQEIRGFFSGYLPIFLMMISFRIFIAPPSTPFSRQITLFEQCTDFSRYFITARAFLKMFLEPYSLVLSVPIAIFFVYGIFAGITLSQIRHPGVLTVLLVLGEMMIGYFFVYITTPQDLPWLIATTLNRLFLQLWSSSIFIALLLINSPESKGHYRLYFS
ncbi:MAG: glycosyltransferase family 39 protein [Candidatus Vecturithrix sp.]|jgi:hypothetical protein|nr:glycosyltransferase family 39 protein [Candidatus Vecturithrix sp.]